MYNPTRSRIFSIKSGSGETLKESCRHGLRPNARQISPRWCERSHVSRPGPASTNAWRRAVRSPTCPPRPPRRRRRRSCGPRPASARQQAHRDDPPRNRAAISTPSSDAHQGTRRRSCSSNRRRTPTRSDNATPTPETTNDAAPSAPTSRAHQRSTRCPPSADHDAPYPAPPIRGSTRHNAATARKFPITPKYSADQPTRTLVVRRGFGLVGEGCSSSADFGEDLFGWLLPDERFGIVVPVFDPDLDRVDELVNAVEGA